eukprot:gnl/TRDRNA2_/TRDRNA2_190583_c0_seq1.p1 gnl/TRDRNA2_/TRDRNA2_190583_c0~~gnl/TRDRNA2_/TRDRNA2_190583_c0_seq1.p1  ORF type:complete len:124 (-),score=35.90 gnl/TRDRNA2_/TRDRNA2_190583_c0_seq1:183-554(-)
MGCFGSKGGLNAETQKVLNELFDKVDTDNSNSMTRTEALAHWNTKFAKASVDQMFGQTDEDQGQTISREEFMKYWAQVKKAGYTEKEIQEEVRLMIDGEVWKDWGKVKITPKAERKSAEDSKA